MRQVLPSLLECSFCVECAVDPYRSSEAHPAVIAEGERDGGGIVAAFCTSCRYRFRLIWIRWPFFSFKYHLVADS